jgi:DNA-binding response OmpR family regulator
VKPWPRATGNYGPPDAPRERAGHAYHGRVHILVVEDEPAIADFLQRGLVAEGHSVTQANDGVEAARLATSADVDLVILDLMLPGRSGGEVLADIRRAKPTRPVIVLTARSEIENKVSLLDLGASDYVTKPFSFEELAARIRAHLREHDEASSTQLNVGGLRMDLVGRRVKRNGTLIRLSPTEFGLLASFMRHPNQVLTRQELLQSVWGYPPESASDVVSVYVGYLRRKLAVGGEPVPIETVRSVGYRLRSDG